MAETSLQNCLINSIILTIADRVYNAIGSSAKFPPIDTFPGVSGNDPYSLANLIKSPL